MQSRRGSPRLPVLPCRSPWPCSDSLWSTVRGQRAGPRPGQQQSSDRIHGSAIRGGFLRPSDFAGQPFAEAVAWSAIRIQRQLVAWQ